jgi:hypothetical protein
LIPLFSACVFGQALIPKRYRRIHVAANEIVNHIVASAWLKLGSDGGEGINTLSQTKIRYRSQGGFIQTIYLPADVVGTPMVILPLDGVFNRKECQVIAYRVGTVDDTGISYPLVETVGQSYPNIAVEPIQLAWLQGVVTPAWLPFTSSSFIPPDVLGNVDQFDAIALLLPALVLEGSTQALSGDLCVLVVRSPQIEGVTIVKTFTPPGG